MDAYFPPHPSLGPHEGKELALMLTGKKKLSFFYTDNEVPEEFEPYLVSGKLHCFTFKNNINIDGDICEFVDYIISNTADNPQIYELADLLNMARNEKFSPEIEKKIGRLLGYEDKDIDYYIQHSLLNLKRLKSKSG